MRYELTDFEWAAIPALLRTSRVPYRRPARKFSEFGSFLIGLLHETLACVVVLCISGRLAKQTLTNNQGNAVLASAN
jgi:hypothetical protein